MVYKNLRVPQYLTKADPFLNLRIHLTLIDLKEVCEETPKDTEGILLRFRILSERYLIFQKGEKYIEEIENCAEEVALYLYLTIQAHKTFTTVEVFWFRWIQQASNTMYTRLYRLQDVVAVREFLILSRDSDPYRDPVIRNNRDFHVFTRERYKELLRTNTLNAILELVKSQDIRHGIFLEKRAKKEIHTLSTRDLLAIYKKYATLSIKEHSRCQKSIKGLFHRDKPSQRHRNLKQE